MSCSHPKRRFPNDDSDRGHADRLPSWLTAMLACPICHENLSEQAEGFVCPRCPQTFPRHPSEPSVDFLPSENFLTADRTDWARRQTCFRSWLESQDAKQGPSGDNEFFSACVRHAGTIDGPALDVGGGDGYLGHWFPEQLHYTCLDPEKYPFRRLSGFSTTESSRRASRPLVLRGIGEYLPFRKEVFRTIFCLGTLNHVSDPRRVLREINRVLQPGGMLLLTLEEVPPFLPLRHLAGWRILKTSLARAVVKWASKRSFRESPDVQPDHVLVPPSEVGLWLGECFRLEKTFFVSSRGVVEMGQRWQKIKSLP